MDDLDLDRELHRALQVTPSPEFVARVRTKIAEAPPPSVWAEMRNPATAVACAVVVVVAVGLWQRDARLKPSPTSMASSPTVVSPATEMLQVAADRNVSTTNADRTTEPTATTPAVSRAADVRTAKASTAPSVVEPPLPEVILAAADVKALHQFVASATERRFLASFEEPPASTPWVMNDLSITPITVEPLERQVVAHN